MDSAAEIVKGGDALESMVRAEIDLQISTAKKYPRVMSKVKQKVIELATQDPQTAEKCFYVVPRQGKPIEGPGVRLAEIVAGSWQNIRAEAIVVEIGETHLTCMGTCHDLESNTAIRKMVKRRITDKHGHRFNDDMITSASNAGCSIALRNAIFSVVPMASLKKEIDQIKKVGMGNERSFKETKKAAFEYFKGLGISKDQVCSMLEVKSHEDIDADKLSILRGTVTAINEGTTTVEDVFKSNLSETKDIKEGKKGYGREKS